MNIEKPKVSLIMKVYNGEAYLKEAINSILNQTYQDFEFIIIDDGSFDRSPDIVRQYTDERIRFLQNEQNMGLCATQNKAIQAARGEYIAVMDCDDISYKTRLEKQVAFLDTNPEYIMCGSYRNSIVNGEEIPFLPIKELSNESLQFSLYFGNMFFTHSSIMFRRKAYQEEGISYGPAKYAEDYQVIIEMAKKGKIYLLPERLIAYRIYGESTSHKKKDEMAQIAADIKITHLKDLDIAGQEKTALEKYFADPITELDFEEFITCTEHVAQVCNADIQKDGNAGEIMNQIVNEYIWKMESYSLKKWIALRQSPYSRGLSVLQRDGFLLFVMSVLHYKKKKENLEINKYGG